MKQTKTTNETCKCICTRCGGNHSVLDCPLEAPVAPTQKEAEGQMGSTPRSLHTPGPWRVYELPVGSRHGYYEIRFQQSNIVVAKCPYSLVQLGLPKDSAKANARLIAASPTMYNFILAQAEKGDRHAAEIIASI